MTRVVVTGATADMRKSVSVQPFQSWYTQRQMLAPARYLGDTRATPASGKGCPVCSRRNRALRRDFTGPRDSYFFRRTAAPAAGSPATLISTLHLAH